MYVQKHFLPINSTVNFCYFCLRNNFRPGLLFSTIPGSSCADNSNFFEARLYRISIMFQILDEFKVSVPFRKLQRCHETKNFEQILFRGVTFMKNY